MDYIFLLSEIDNRMILKELQDKFDKLSIKKEDENK